MSHITQYYEDGYEDIIDSLYCEYTSKSLNVNVQILTNVIHFAVIGAEPN